MKQTALAQWPPDAPTRFLIDPDQLQPGQWWSGFSDVNVWSRGTAENPAYPVWVSELLEIPEPLPEIAWLNGLPVAMRNDLPLGTTYRCLSGGIVHEVRHPLGEQVPLIVVAWPDGSKPVPPGPDSPDMRPVADPFTDTGDDQ